MYSKRLSKPFFNATNSKSWTQPDKNRAKQSGNIQSRLAFANGFGNVFEAAELTAKIASVYSLAKLLARMANVQL